MELRLARWSVDSAITMRPKQLAVFPLLVVALCHFASRAEQTNDWGPATCGARMSISLKAEQTKVTAARLPILRVRIHNLTTNESFGFRLLNAPSMNADLGLPCRILSPSGKDISPPAEKVAAGSGLYYTIGPGKEMSFDLDLGFISNLKELGTYTVTAKKLVQFPNKGRCDLVSNALRITVVARESLSSH